MSKFWIVLKYELKEYLTNKGFVALTLVFAIIGLLGPFAPRVFDLSDFTGVQVVEKSEESSEKKEDKDVYLYIDSIGVISEELLNSLMPEDEWKPAASMEEMKTALEEREAEAGFVVVSPTEYEHYMYNKGMMDHVATVFEQAMKISYRANYCAQHGLDLEEVTEMFDVPLTSREEILNKDTSSNYWYCYFLVIIVFMLVVFYGQMIAVAVTNEKSNRAIEVLVTTTTPNSLLFGKVISGAIAGLVQAGAILGAVLISYRINSEVWGGALDMFLKIPGDVLLTFVFFGMGGYLFFAFLFGAMGALVSKTEDVSKSIGGLMMVIMVVYIFSLAQLTNVEGPIIKVLSFLPFSSYSTMFARIAMGTVAAWEIALSVIILIASIFGAGLLGAKIYRMGTLRYGNPISLSTALKDLKKSE
ncbi:MAG: ABC transporter permease [Acetatifactor sp.]|nr:ABC transporter permease [Acetatifactor sp.]